MTTASVMRRIGSTVVACGLRALAAAALAIAASSVAAGPATFGVPEGYALVWADEFDRDGPPDPAKWGFDTAMNKEGWHNRELQYYAADRPENAVVRDGTLRITARREALKDAGDWGGQAYTSARMLTRGRADWTYGFFEVRARMPCGKGTWPAIWMLGSGGTWPDDGELDIMEYVGSDPSRTSSAVHTAAGHAARSVHGFAKIRDACQAFHRYQMHWTPDGVTFGVDGFAHLHYPRLDAGKRGWPFDAPQFMLLNIAIGGWLGGPVDDRIFPVTMEVDYVRVYQRVPPAPK
jgi:beta-glucanase (GH16 family)